MSLNKSYTFLNARQAKEEDFIQLTRLLETHFETNQDVNQMQINDANTNWIRDNFPECLHIIVIENKVIGVTLIFPSTCSLMQDFVSGKISEATLGEKSKEEIRHYDDMEAIYICFAFVLSEHRRQGLSFTSMLKSIQAILPSHKRIDLFGWIFSAAGGELTKKLSDALKLNLFCREAS
jgi:hypothetical protein